MIYPSSYPPIMIYPRLRIIIFQIPLLYFYSEIYRVFLLVGIFDLASSLYFLPDFVNRPLIFFVRSVAIEWSIEHNYIIYTSQAIRQCVNGIFWRENSLFLAIFNEHALGDQPIQIIYFQCENLPIFFIACIEWPIVIHNLSLPTDIGS